MKKSFYLLFILPLLTACGSSQKDFDKACKFVEKVRTEKTEKITSSSGFNSSVQFEVFKYDSLPKKCAFEVEVSSRADKVSDDTSMVKYYVLLNKNKNIVYHRMQYENQVNEYYYQFNYKTFDKYATLTKVYVQNGNAKKDVREGIARNQVSQNLKEMFFNVGSQYAMHDMICISNYLLWKNMHDQFDAQKYEDFISGHNNVNFSVGSSSMSAKYSFKAYLSDENYLVPPDSKTEGLREISVNSKIKFSNMMCTEYSFKYKLDKKEYNVLDYKKVSYSNKYIEGIDKYL